MMSGVMNDNITQHNNKCSLMFEPQKADDDVKNLFKFDFYGKGEVVTSLVWIQRG